MTVRVAAGITLALQAMAMTAALTSAAARAESIAMTPALAEVIDAAKQGGAATIRWTNLMLGWPDGAALAEAGINRMFGTKLKLDCTPGPRRRRRASSSPMCRSPGGTPIPASIRTIRN